MKRSRSSGGFTLLEIMLVVLIIGILAGLAVTHFGGRMADARRTATRQEISNTDVAIELFHLDYGRLPIDLGELVNPPARADGSRPSFYLEVAPRDAYGRVLVYWVPPEHFGRVYDLYSMGPNGTDDRGEGDDVIPQRFVVASNEQL